MFVISEKKVFKFDLLADSGLITYGITCNKSLQIKIAVGRFDLMRIMDVQ